MCEARREEGSRGQRGEEALPSCVWRTELHDREHRQSLEAQKGKNTNGKVASSAGLGTGFRFLLSRTEREFTVGCSRPQCLWYVVEVRQEASTLLHRMGDPARALEPPPPQVSIVL